MTAARPSVTGKALWYIETRLQEDVSLDAVAVACGVSRFHLSRAFALSTRSTLSAYVRARRLSEAARALTQGAPDILDIALNSGYNSHEAFTRAFRQHFATTPERFRDDPASTQRPLQEPLRMNPSAPTPLVPPRLAESPELLLFGLGQRFFRGGDAAIPALWNRFGPYIGALPGQIGRTTYGVIIDNEPGFDYICAVEVRAFPDARDIARAIPASPGTTQPELTSLTLPPAPYAVFEHRDHISTIFPTMKAIWEHGLSDAQLTPAPAPAFERYGESFDARTGLGGFEIWIPIRT